MNTLKSILLILALFISSQANAAEPKKVEAKTPEAKIAEVRTGEPWKGHTQVPPVEVGLLTGFSLYGSSANWSVLATAAYMIDDKGFVDDLDNRLWVEVEMGPAFFNSGMSSQTGLQYSAHLRWDFTENEYWTFYGLGGLGGFVLPQSLGSTFTIHPRFGAGVEYQTKTALLFRGEISADFAGLGIAFNF